MIFQYLFKCLFILWAHKKIKKSFDRLMSVYRDNENSVENSRILETFVGGLGFGRRLFAVFAVLTFVFIVYIPFAVLMGMYFLYDTRYLIYPIEIPGLHIEAGGNYEITMLLNLLLAHVNAPCYSFLDVIFVVQMLHVHLMASIICKKIRAIDQMAGARHPSAMDISTSLRNIICLQNEMRE